MDTENSKISFCSFPFLLRVNPAHFYMSPDHEKVFGGVFVNAWLLPRCFPLERTMVYYNSCQL